MRRQHLAPLLALPAFLVPAIYIPLVIWARDSFLLRHPQYEADPPTISRAISDPVIGGPFADAILLIVALIALSLSLVLWAYGLAIFRVGPGRRLRAVLVTLLGLFMASQVTASAGMVLTTQYTFFYDHDLHMLGSYVFFAFQALAILLAATLCRLLLRQRGQAPACEVIPFAPATHRFRFRFALVIVALALLYGVLFVVKDRALPLPPYAVQVAYTQLEVLVIGCFVLFLGSYGVDIHQMIRRGQLDPRPRPPGEQVGPPPDRLPEPRIP